MHKKCWYLLIIFKTSHLHIASFQILIAHYRTFQEIFHKGSRDARVHTSLLMVKIIYFESLEIL